MFINYLQQAAVALVCVACGYVILHVILSYSFVSSKCAVPRSLLRVLEASRAVSRALNTSLGGVQREAFTLIWMCHLFAACCWWWKCYSTSLRRWRWVPDFAKASDFCIPMPWWWERQSGLLVQIYFLLLSFLPSAPLSLLLRSWGYEQGNQQIQGSYLPSVPLVSIQFWLSQDEASQLNQCHQGVWVVVGCVTGGACSAWGRDCCVGTITGPDACGRCLGGTTGDIAA